MFNVGPEPGDRTTAPAPDRSFGGVDNDLRWMGEEWCQIRHLLWRLRPPRSTCLSHSSATSSLCRGRRIIDCRGQTTEQIARLDVVFCDSSYSSVVHRVFFTQLLIGNSPRCTPIGVPVAVTMRRRLKHPYPFEDLAMSSFPAGACQKGGRNSAPVLKQMAREFYEPIIPIVLELHAKGLSLRAIGRELEKRGIKPRIGYPPYRWAAAQVRRALLRGLAKPVDVPRGPAVQVELDETSTPQADPLGKDATAAPQQVFANISVQKASTMKALSPPDSLPVTNAELKPTAAARLTLRLRTFVNDERPKVGEPSRKVRSKRCWTMGNHSRHDVFFSGDACVNELECSSRQPAKP